MARRLDNQVRHKNIDEIIRLSLVTEGRGRRILRNGADNFDNCEAHINLSNRRGDPAYGERR